MPFHDSRTRCLATDALASVDVFRIMVHLTFSHVFGMFLVCLNCPDRNSALEPCQDMFGSSATSEDVILGRVDAVHTSIEAQKPTGTLHAHSQVLVQCLHQHTCLFEIFQKKHKQPGNIIQSYFNYKKNHVIPQVYETYLATLQSKLEGHEKAWPEYKDSSCFMNPPPYLQATSRTFVSCQQKESKVSLHEEGKTWLHNYLYEDVEQLQIMKQHHVHLRNPDTNIREPLGACRRTDNPKLCKADLPRMNWLVRRAVILCIHLLEQMGLATRGRRCQPGSLRGPMNHESINGTHRPLPRDAILMCNDHLVFQS